MVRTAGCWFLWVAFAVGCRAQAVVCFGDSLTVGVGAEPKQAYPDYLRRDLAAAGYKVTVVNAGVGGMTSGEALPKLPEVLAAHPSVVVLELGANDAIRSQPTEQTERNLRSMIEALQKAHAKVVMAGLDFRPLMTGWLPPGLKTPAFLGLYPLFEKLSQAYGLVDIPFLLQGVYGVYGSMSPDYIHPNGVGYEKVAQTVLPYVEAALGKPGA